MTPLAPVSLPGRGDAGSWLSARTEASLAHARALVAELLDGAASDRSGATASDASALLRGWDEINRALGDASAAGSLFAAVHPDAAVRTIAEETQVAVDRLSTELRQNRALYDMFAALERGDLDRLDPLAVRMLDKTLEEFERAGVDRDEQTRDRLAHLWERLTLVDQEFGRAIRDDVRTVRVAVARLDGMPQDWLDAHLVDDDGRIEVTTDYPDSMPALMFVHDADVRREVISAFLDRGWPDNDGRLHELFDLRHEVATLLGHDDWASYDAAVKMIGEGPAIPAFVDRIADAADVPMRRDLAALVARLRQDRPGADGIDRADSAYYQELLRQEQYDVDSRLVRSYFSFEKVRRGLLDVTGRLFGLRYEPVPEAVVWDPDVTAYDVFEAGPGRGQGEQDAPASLGRIYLDLHPRDGKFTHAAQFTLTRGVGGRQLPEGVLVCNFGRGLMEHDQVVTLFHEFGHLLHHVLGGHVDWYRFSGVATEWDFVEAPSQMLEEWAWDATVLRAFATNADGEPIPADLVDRMRAAEEFGQGVYVRQQMFYAAMSYAFHTERPTDLTARLVELNDQYSPYLHIEGTHQHANFGHLGGYSSAYYTYAWSLVIARDLFSAFSAGDLFDPVIARRYRDTVLAAGGTRDAADLTQDFLGRPFTFDAYATWLAR